MPVTGTGILSVPIDALAALVAASTSFQDWTDSADATEALTRVYRVELGPVDGTTWKRPFARIGQPEEFDVHRGGYGAGMLVLDFEADVSADYRAGGAAENDFASALMEFTNSVGAIVSEIRANAENTSGALVIRSMPMVLQPQRPRDEVEPDGETPADYYWCRFHVLFGADFAQF